MTSNNYTGERHHLTKNQHPVLKENLRP